DGFAGDVGAFDLDAPGIDRQVARHGIQEGRLAGPVGADDRHELPAGNFQRQPAQRPRLDGRAGVEGDFQVLCAQHGQAPFLPSRRRFIMGMTRAMVTSTAVTRFRSWACRPMKSLFRASAMKKRYTMAPRMTASVASTSLRDGRILSPTITAARPMTMVPMPMEISDPPCVWANSAPASPTSAFDSAMPARIMAPVLT